MTAPITSNRPTTTRLHHYAGRHSHGSGIPVETFFAPAWGASTPVEIFFAHAHPKWLIFDHFHLAGAIFLSLRHPKLPPGATQGRSFFHTAPRDDTESPPVWRAPRGMGPGRGAGGRWLGLAGLRHDRTPSAAGVEGAGGSGGPGRGAGGRRQGQGGPRDRPLRAAGSRVAISRAGRRPPAHSAARPTGQEAQRAGRRPRAHRAARPSRHPATPKGAGTEVPAPLSAHSATASSRLRPNVPQSWRRRRIHRNMPPTTAAPRPAPPIRPSKPVRARPFFGLVAGTSGAT